jgi:hydrogenase expression/formation protein HypC
MLLTKETNMCVAIAGTILKMNQKLATIDMHGARREVSIELLDDVKEGDEIMVHAGVAIAKIDNKA